MADDIPPITGPQLIRLLIKDGWQERLKRAREGSFLYKVDESGRRRTTVIASKRGELKPGTLSHILGPSQSNIGRTGLAELIKRYGLK